MDSLGNPLEIGKYYRVGPMRCGQYIGKSDDGSRFNFEYRKWFDKTKKWVTTKPPEYLENPENTPVLLSNEECYDEDYATDDEWQNDPLDDHNELNGGKRRRKKTRKYKRKTRKHRKKSRKHRKR